MKSSSEIILKFILSEYYPPVLKIISSRVDKTPDSQRRDCGFDSHDTLIYFFQESVMLCNFTSLFATTRNNENFLTL